jgi:hypothetical protein
MHRRFQALKLRQQRLLHRQRRLEQFRVTSALRGDRRWLLLVIQRQRRLLKLSGELLAQQRKLLEAEQVLAHRRRRLVERFRKRLQREFGYRFSDTGCRRYRRRLRQKRRRQTQLNRRNPMRRRRPRQRVPTASGGTPTATAGAAGPATKTGF